MTPGQLHQRQIANWEARHDFLVPNTPEYRAVMIPRAIAVDYDEAVRDDRALTDERYAQLDLFYSRYLAAGSDAQPLHASPNDYNADLQGAGFARPGCCRYHAALANAWDAAHEESLVRSIVAVEKMSPARARFVAQLHGLADLFAVTPAVDLPTPDRISFTRCVSAREEVDEATRVAPVLAWGRKEGRRLYETDGTVYAMDNSMRPEGDGYATVYFTFEALLNSLRRKRYI